MMISSAVSIFRKHLILSAIILPASLGVAALSGTSPIASAHAQSLNDLTKGLGQLGLGGGSDSAVPANVESGLIETLVVGSQKVIGQLGQSDGFYGDSKARIPLPGAFQQAQSALKLAGLSGMADDLELRLNRAAEQATPVAQDLILDAIRGLTFSDAAAIFNGPNDAATQYLEKSTGSDIAAAMRPIVNDALADVGALQAFDDLLGEYKNLPFVPDVKTDLTSHVLDYANKGIFGYLAEEEAAIRTNPAARTTDLLKDVFGS